MFFTQEREQSQRQQWSNKREFLLSCISMCVGVGNVWRFAFVALENGGGAFLIPYLVVLVFIGKPLYYLELILGQFPSTSAIKMWAICPAFKGTACFFFIICRKFNVYVTDQFLQKIHACRYWLRTGLLDVAFDDILRVFDGFVFVLLFRLLQ